MKKIIALFLVVLMCFSLVACGDDSQTNENGSQQEHNNNETNKEIDIKKVDVVGTWINIASTSHGMKMIIEEDGTGSVALGEQVMDLVWERIDDDTMTITADSEELIFEIGVSDGIVELLWQGVFSHYTMVSEQDYNNMIEIVELTSENWQNYFEVKPYAKPMTNDFDEITDLMISSTLVLKDEYANKFAASDGAVEVSFGGEYRCPIEYNSSTKELTLGTPYTKEENEKQGYYISSEEITNTEKLANYDEYGLVIGGGTGCTPNTLKINGDIVTADSSYYETIEIIRIQGNLYFKK